MAGEVPNDSISQQNAHKHGSAVSYLSLKHDGWVNNNILLSDQKCHQQEVNVGTVFGKGHSWTIVLLLWNIGFMWAVYQNANSHGPCLILKTRGKKS